MHYCLQRFIETYVLIVTKLRYSLHLTARQYGEVVLPDESTGQSPGSSAGKLSRCKEGMARVFAIRVLSWLSITRVAVQVILRLGNYPGIVILLTVVAWSGFVKHYDSV
jgi:hypothetical protein